MLDGDELKAMVEASLDGCLTTGRFNEAFEKKLANYLGVRYLLTTNSGSSANLLAFSALTSNKLGNRAIKVGDEVIGIDWPMKDVSLSTKDSAAVSFKEARYFS